MLCCCIVCVSANYSKTYEDSFSFMSQNPQYIELYEAINNCKPSSNIESCYETLKSSLGTTAQDWITLMKASLNSAYYYLELSPKKNIKRAKELITYSYKIYEALKNANVSEKLLMPLHFCCLSMDYLAHPLKIATGLESLKVIDEAYEKYPLELSIANLYASRKLNAPAIGGGNTSEAFEIFSSIVTFIEEVSKSSNSSTISSFSSVSPWECFDAYKGIAECHEKHEDTNKATLYYKKALEIYPDNTPVLSALSKVQEN